MRENWLRDLVRGSLALGAAGGLVVFGVRLWEPKRMNLPLTRFNRCLIVIIAVLAAAALLWALIALCLPKLRGALRAVVCVLLAALTAAAFTYVTPIIVQYTQEFVYFGEAGLSTKALMRAIGFALGIVLCALFCLCACKTHRALSEGGAALFLTAALLFFGAEYGFKAVASLQRMKLIPLSDFVFELMVFGDEHAAWFLFAQLLLGLAMLVWVIFTHRTPVGEFANRALLRKEKARLRSCRRWANGLFFCGLAVLLTVTLLHYYDTKPPAEVQPESYELSDGVISVDLSSVADGHLHKFSYVTPNGFDVRFLVVKKPVGTAWGVGLDACEICGIAGYFERGDEVVCRRCDVVMNKNTIGFKGGCNPIPFAYEVRGGHIYIDVKELERHERRFR